MCVSFLPLDFFGPFSLLKCIRHPCPILREERLVGTFTALRPREVSTLDRLPDLTLSTNRGQFRVPIYRARPAYRQLSPRASLPRSSAATHHHPLHLAVAAPSLLCLISPTAQGSFHASDPFPALPIILPVSPEPSSVSIVSTSWEPCPAPK